ncbi:MAG: alpha/beta fold hydrolase [bacterium]
MGEAMRARVPDASGYAVNDAVRIYYEVAGHGSSTIVFVQPYQIATSRLWKMQVPYLSRHFRTVVYDPRGNGKSDRPATGYGIDSLVGDVLSVLDDLEIERCALMTSSLGAKTSLHLAARYPERVTGMVIVGAGLSVPSTSPAEAEAEAWRRLVLGDYDRYVEQFFAACFPEPHSSRAREEGWAWAHETDPRVLVEAIEQGWRLSDARSIVDRIRCPVLLIHGTGDLIVPYDRGVELSGHLPYSRLVTIETPGHLPYVRDPVRVNLLVRDFLGGPGPAQITWTRAQSRRPRALFISSPIGLGHVQRDLAIARDLRKLVPDLEIHWWTQHPVTAVLKAAGEIIHPACYELASESRHFEAESFHHELHAFYAFRRMDEIFCANFMLFHDATRETAYDVWIGDESWEVDYYLHENPELKVAPYVFLTDMIGFLPVAPDADPREANLCADYNAEMIEQRARYPYVRDLSLYVGEYEELPDAAFGPGLPKIRDWARTWFEPVGYIVSFDPAQYRDTVALRKRLDYGVGYPLLFAAAGGTATGRHLLQKAIDAFGVLKQDVPDARMVVVTGPRIDPREMSDGDGLTTRAYVHNLFEHLACADAAVVQGGLSTTMELVALRRPFAYFPLAKHWEQVHHVAHRLGYYGAGTPMDYAQTAPEDLAAALGRLLSKGAAYREIRSGGAHRAARRIEQVFRRGA